VRLHSFKADPQNSRLTLGFSGVDTFAKSSDSQLILYSDEPFDFRHFRMKGINLLLNGWPNHFRLLPLSEPDADASSGLRSGIGILEDAGGPLCGSGDYSQVPL
jgi:hypothetical protein